MKNLLTVLFVILLLGANGAMADIITPTVQQDSGSPYNTTGLTGFATYGDDMDDMKVTVGFLGGSTESALWADTGPNAGAATGTGWSLSLNGNSNTIYFELLNSGATDIVQLIIDAGPGMTVFDFYYSPEYSPGSSGGGNILNPSPSGEHVYGPAGMSVTGTYRNSVAINGTFYGDLYTVLDIAMVGATGSGGLAQGQTLRFYSDTDNASTAIEPGEVPEPATMILLGSGLIGLAGYGRKKFFKK